LQTAATGPPSLQLPLRGANLSMSIKSKRSIGCTLLAVGICTAVFSYKIVFPGLESLLGIETIVGKKNVVYLADGGYAYTNPGAMLRWNDPLVSWTADSTQR
jgi:hypothetical protein